MNASTAKDFLPLVQALADGKTIQIRSSGGGHWSDLTIEIKFDSNPDFYRIKPEPREWKACVATGWHDEPGRLFHYDKDDDNNPAFEVIRVREILS